MNEYNNNYYSDDVEIDLVDMIFYFLKKWKVLILAIIVGAIVGAGFAALRASRTETVVTELPSVEEISKDDYDIDESSIDSMVAASNFRKEYLLQRTYNENSIFMQLDPNGFYRGTLRYFVTADTDDIYELASVYGALLYEDGLFQEVADAAGFDCDPSYMRELLGASSTVKPESSVIISTGTASDVNAGAEADTAEESESAGTDNEAGSIMGIEVTYTVMAPDEDAAVKMLDVMRQEAEDLNSVNAREYDDLLVTDVIDTVQFYMDPSYFATQYTYINQMNTYLNNAKNIEDKFTDDEMEYYTIVYLNSGELAEAEELEEAENAEAAAAVEDAGTTGTTGTTGSSGTVTTVVAPKPNYAKWILIGIFGFIMVWGFVYLVIYLADGSIKTAGELKDCYNIPLIGRLGAGSKSGWVDKLYARVKGTPDTPSYVSSVINSMETGQVALCGDTDCMEVKKAMAELAGEGANVALVDFASKSSEALEEVKEAGSEILVIRVGKTKRSEIKRELEICRMQGINVAGMVAIDNA